MSYYKYETKEKEWSDSVGYKEDDVKIIEPVSDLKISRDPDDDKFIGCAKDAHALYIVSGDKDILVLKKYENISI